MKKTNLKSILSLVLAFTIAFASVGMTACSQQKTTETSKMSFEYVLTEKDIDEALSLITELETHIDSGGNRKIVSTAKNLEENINYILNQYDISKVIYYSDLSNEEYYDMYIFAEDSYMTVFSEYIRIMKKLYNSDLAAKEKVFADWSKKNIQDLNISSEEILNIEKQQQTIVNSYLSLNNSGTEEWSQEVDNLYFEFTAGAQQLAQCYGYDNYYEYATKEIYNREYSLQQREALRQNVKNTILPLGNEIYDLYIEKCSQLTDTQKEQLEALKSNTCLPTNEYLTGYINSYPKQMKTIMNYLFEREAVVYADSENSFATAYTGYAEYSEQPYIFFGNDTQDLLTVVHELGHYAAYYHFDVNLPVDTAETHSQSNEWLMLDYLDGKLDQDVYQALCLWRLSKGLDNIVICTVLDDYEETVYTTDKIDSPEDFKYILYSVLDEYDGINQLKSYKGWYTYAQKVILKTPVYYLSYATSELVAMSFYAVAEENGYQTAQEIYIDLCLETPTDNTFFDTLMAVGLPDPFDAENLTKTINAFKTKFSEESVDYAA